MIITLPALSNWPWALAFAGLCWIMYAAGDRRWVLKTANDLDKAEASRAATATKADVADLKIAIAVLTKTVESLASASISQGATLHEIGARLAHIAEDTAEMRGNVSEWRKRDPLIVMADRRATATVCTCQHTEA